jgi:hypothetical protein
MVILAIPVGFLRIAENFRMFREILIIPENSLEFSRNPENL